MSDSEDALDLFQEPDDYYEPEKPATFASHQLLDGTELKLRLVGYSPLWGHHLWNAGKVIADYLERNAAELIANKCVLELGAGAGLPSLVCGLRDARYVLVTDYPDADLIENLRMNVDHVKQLNVKVTIEAEGLLWGASVDSVLRRLPSPREGFDVVILADLLFNHSEHSKLIDTVKATMKRSEDSQALVFFTPYRPWLLEKDLAFFQLAMAEGLVVTKILEHVMDKVMFEADPGDELLRRTVFAYKLTWGANTT